MDAIERIEKCVDQLFNKVNELAESFAVSESVLKGIKEGIDRFPCEEHGKAVALLNQEIFPDGKNSKVREHDKEIFAVKFVWSAIVGIIAAVGIIVSIVMAFWK
jgi:hypothetical protein